MNPAPLLILAHVVWATGVSASALCCFHMRRRPDALRAVLWKDVDADRSLFTDREWRLRNIAVHSSWIGCLLMVTGLFLS